MIIQAIELENIRSYKHQLVKFDSGINLLSGDIGSGKSSILQALEFALFGFKRGDLEGIHLLRKGEQEGFVRVVFSMNNTSIEILRNLKKTKTSISQENGFLTINNETNELSPTELNAQIFELVNFPKEFLSKDKNLLYRFTIYTVQEQLKEILFTENEKKLEVIRKLFQIDKYKQLRDAIEIYLKELRDSIKELKIKLELKEQTRKEKEELKQQLKEFITEFNEISKIKEIFITEYKEFKENSNEIKEKLDLMNEKKTTCEKNIFLLEQAKEKIEAYKKDLGDIKQKDIDVEQKKFILEKKEIEEKNKLFNLQVNEKKQIIDEIKIKLEQESSLDNNIKELEREKMYILSEVKVLDNNIKNLKIKVEDIEKLKECPVCLQDVGDKHKRDIKSHISTEEKDLINKKEKLNEDIKSLDKKLKNEQEKFLELKEKKKELEHEKENLQKIRDTIKELEIKELKLSQESEQLKNQIKRKEELEEKIKKEKEIELKLSDMYRKQELIQKKLSSIKKKIKEDEEKQQSLLTKEKSILEKETTLKTKISEKEQRVEKLEDNLNQFKILEESKKNLENDHSFLSEKTSKITEIIEKYVFTKYYIEFTEEFEKIFRNLIEDNEIEVRLSDQFAIVVEQNGYDIDIKNLSGGEKSSIALAYRLALKRIIEQTLSRENTFNFLVLDEPTDGFSSEQVDRLGDILRQSEVQQIIVVSHDPKVETIAENILRVEKNVHVSTVISN